eukprot:1157654-Pelagomonas_calceolata.AAC.2
MAQDLIDAAKQQLSINRQRLHQLCTVSGMVPPDDSDVHEAFKQALQEWDAQCVAAQGSGGYSVSGTSLEAGEKEAKALLCCCLFMGA